MPVFGDSCPGLTLHQPSGDHHRRAIVGVYPQQMLRNAQSPFDAGYELVAEFYDAAVSGADPIDSRAGFSAMLERIEGNGVRTIIVETASRFARDLMVQEVGHAKLRERGIDLIAADNPGSFIDDTPTAKLVRQVLGAISEFDKAMTVAKLRGAREAQAARAVAVAANSPLPRSARLANRRSLSLAGARASQSRPGEGPLFLPRASPPAEPVRLKETPHRSWRFNTASLPEEP
jgi:hypothetical protein